MELTQENGSREEASGGGAEDDEYLRLKAEHAALDQKLHELENNRYPSSQEDLEIKTLKKQKLALKTRMEELLNSKG